jgi:hypothetical protein
MRKERYWQQSGKVLGAKEGVLIEKKGVAVVRPYINIYHKDLYFADVEQRSRDYM